MAMFFFYHITWWWFALLALGWVWDDTKACYVMLA